MAQFNPTESSLKDLTFAGATSVSMAADATSDSFYINGTNNYCIQYVITAAAAPVGSMELQGSNTDSNYVTITTQAIIATTTSGMFNVDKGKYRFVRIFYDRTSGSGTLSANINIGVS